MHLLRLEGCRPTPLAHYLKALGVLRLVAEQADATARGAWRGDSFMLASKLDVTALLGFFLRSYSPTPLVTPWNGGSGFYPKDNKAGIEPIANSTAPRLAIYRSAIDQCRQLVGDRDERPDGVDKERMLQQCRRRWRGRLAAWLDAAVTLATDGAPAYPALLGTGGNDGRLDFTNNFMQRLCELFDTESPEAAPRLGTAELLQAALFETPQFGLGSTAVGQFFPGAAGGANSSTGFSSDTLVNPWDFVLMLEGAIVFASSITRRAFAGGLPQAAAPFAMRSAAAGYGSAADENSRGEQWMPIWNSPARYAEVQRLFGEARCQSKRAIAKRPLETARAIARLGVARGITAFERYGYIERNGLANLAVPLGRWTVARQPHQELLDEISPWYDRFERAASEKNAPNSFARAARRCQEAMMDCCRDGATPARWLELLIRLGEAESQMLQSPQFTAGKSLQPLGYPTPLSSGWLTAAQAVGERPEFRLALAIAGQHGSVISDRRRTDHAEQAEIDEADELRWIMDRRDPVRRHWMPLVEHDRGVVARPHRLAIAGERLAAGPNIVCHGLNLRQDLLAIVQRRLVIARREGKSFIGLRPAFGVAASLADIQAWLEGEVDERLISKLVRPLMALDWASVSRAVGAANSKVRQWLHKGSDGGESRLAEQVSLYGVLRLCYHYEPLLINPRSAETKRIAEAAEGTSEAAELRSNKIPVPIKLEVQPFQRLLAGDLAGAVRAAARRLQISGLHPHLDRAIGDASLAIRIATALSIPISRTTATLLAEALTYPKLEDEPPIEGAELDYETA